MTAGLRGRGSPSARRLGDPALLLLESKDTVKHGRGSCCQTRGCYGVGSSGGLSRSQEGEGLQIVTCSSASVEVPTLISCPWAWVKLHLQKGSPWSACGPATLSPSLGIGLGPQLFSEARGVGRGAAPLCVCEWAHPLRRPGGLHPAVLPRGGLPGVRVETGFCHLPSARGQAHAWLRMSFSTGGCSLSSPEPASHHLSESAWVCQPLPFPGKVWTIPVAPSQLSGVWAPEPQRWHFTVHVELPPIHCLLRAGGGTGCFHPFCPPQAVLTTTLKGGGELPLSQIRKLRPREGD